MPQVTGIFAIIVCGTLGVMGIHFAAPRLLEPAEHSDSEGEGEAAAAAAQGEAEQQQYQPPPPEPLGRSGVGGGKLGGSATRLAGMLADGDTAAAGLGLHHRRAASGAVMASELVRMLLPSQPCSHPTSCCWAGLLDCQV